PKRRRSVAVVKIYDDFIRSRCPILSRVVRKLLSAFICETVAPLNRAAIWDKVSPFRTVYVVYCTARLPAFTAAEANRSPLPEAALVTDDPSSSTANISFERTN